MYKVIKAFTDLTDNRYPYEVGDVFPREGINVSERRLDELSSDKNRRGIPLIEEVKEDFMNPPEEPKEEVKEEPKAEAPKKRGRRKNASNTD